MSATFSARTERMAATFSMSTTEDRQHLAASTKRLCGALRGSSASGSSARVVRSALPTRERRWLAHQDVRARVDRSDAAEVEVLEAALIAADLRRRSAPQSL